MPMHRATNGRLRHVAAALLAASFLSAPLCRGEEAGDFEVHDFSLWIVDAGQGLGNPRASIPSALPATVATTRTAASSREERTSAPIGMLTFHGAPADGLDVDLRLKTGAVVAHWPPGELMPNRVRWSGMPAWQLVKQASPSELSFVDGGHWFQRAREGDALFIKHGARSERFLAYDLEQSLGATIRLEGGPDTYKVINASDRPLYDVLLAKRTPQGLRLAWLDELPAEATVVRKPDPKKEKAKPADDAEKLFDDPKPAAAPAEAAPAGAPEKVDAPPAEVAPAPAEAAAAKPAAANPPIPKLFGGLAKKLEEQVAANRAKQAAEKQAAGANGGRALFGGLPPGKEAVGVEVTLSAPLAVDSSEAREASSGALAARLRKTGLSEHEVALAVERYGPLLFESDALVACARLDPATVDEQLQLSVFPLPRKTVRVALVVVRKADPQLGVEVESLIAQLGDTSFERRETAEQRLVELGSIAYPSLQAALTEKDLEIVIRSERILIQQNQPLSPKGRPAAGIRAPRVMVNGVLQAPVRVVPAAPAR